MRILSAGLAAVLVLGASAAQASSDIYFSEYVEGSSYNKALEIYNAADASVDLNQYSIAIYFNGSTSAGTTIDLDGTLAPGATYVVASTDADDKLLATADQTYGGSLFNGDDAVVLSNGGTIDDVIGQIGVDPGSAWGSGDLTTQNHTLRRNGDVTQGRTDGASAFDPADEWSSYPEDTFAGLGSYGPGETPQPVAFGVCGDQATPIHAIQGDGDASPLIGETEVVEAIVTASFLGQDGLDGFYVQTADDEVDNDSATSEGLFVYDTDTDGQPPIKVGDRVRVRGRVSEYYNQTELGSIDGLAVCSSGHSVAPATLKLPYDSRNAPEAVEGMAVQINQRLTVSGNADLGQYGELTLSADGRLYTPTSVVAPGEDANALADKNARNLLVLDDGNGHQDPDPIPYPAPELTAYNTVRDGDTVTHLKGVLAYDFGVWTLEPTEQPIFDPVNPRPTPGALPRGGNLRVASANLENYFNGDGMGGGFPTERGADTYKEFQRQRAKTITELASLHADVIGLMEVENDGYGSHSAIQDLVDGLNAAVPGNEHYAFVDPGTDQLGGDAIANDIIYNTKKVSPVGSPATLLTTPFDYGSRPPLARTFETRNHVRFTYVANHLRSKGSCPSDGDNAAQGDGQGCWNVQRVQGAKATAAWLATNPTGADTANIILMGDFNSYTREDPIIAFEKNGYTSLLKQKAGKHAYTYTYDARSGALDHALVSKSLRDDVVAVVPFHINADEPSALDYNTEYHSDAQLSSLYAPTRYRASDHDPLVVALRLQSGRHAHHHAHCRHNGDHRFCGHLSHDGSSSHATALLHHWLVTVLSSVFGAGSS